MPPEAWRLVPESTVTGERRQFFVYGRGMGNAKVTSDPSVKAEPQGPQRDGRVFSLYLTLAPRHPDSLGIGGKPGTREIRIETADTSVAFTLKVMDEAVRR